MANNAPQGRALKTYTKKESAMYYVGLAGQNVFYNVIGTALTYYLQFTILIPAFTVSVIMAIARVWDAVNDPMMGTICERLQPKKGKYWVYIRWGAVPFGLAAVLTYTTPNLSYGLKIVWALLTLITIVVLGSGIYLWLRKPAGAPATLGGQQGHRQHCGEMFGRGQGME